MSMDPDGTNRIVQQRISEWHREIDGHRKGRLLEENGGAEPSRVSTMQNAAMRHTRRMIAAVHRGFGNRRALLPRRAVDPAAAGLVDGRHSP